MYGTCAITTTTIVIIVLIIIITIAKTTLLLNSYNNITLSLYSFGALCLIFGI